MKSINVTFEDNEFDSLKKEKGTRSWHNFIMNLADSIDFQEGLKVKITGVEENNIFIKVFGTNFSQTFTITMYGNKAEVKPY